MGFFWEMDFSILFFSSSRYKSPPTAIIQQRRMKRSLKSTVSITSEQSLKTRKKYRKSSRTIRVNSAQEFSQRKPKRTHIDSLIFLSHIVVIFVPEHTITDHFWKVTDVNTPENVHLNARSAIKRSHIRAS